MDSNAGWSVVKATFHVSGELQKLLLELKQECSDEDYRKYALAIAATIDRMNVELLNPTLVRFPGLRDRIERSLAGRGQIT